MLLKAVEIPPKRRSYEHTAVKAYFASQNPSIFPPIYDRLSLNPLDATEASCFKRLQLYFPDKAGKMMKSRVRFVKWVTYSILISHPHLNHYPAYGEQSPRQTKTVHSHSATSEPSDEMTWSQLILFSHTTKTKPTRFYTILISSGSIRRGWNVMMLFCLNLRITRRIKLPVSSASSQLLHVYSLNELSLPPLGLHRPLSSGRNS